MAENDSFKGLPSSDDTDVDIPAELRRRRKYDVGSLIAKGGMGAILNAREAAVERTVAMKVMLPGHSQHDLLRFIEEAKITGQLEHPNIVPVHELSVDEKDQVYYTMKFVKGVTLKKALENLRKGDADAIAKFQLPALLTVYQKVCDAVAFAHSKGVIHRDLKPENIMLGDYGEVLVMDWGLAKALGAKKMPAKLPAKPSNPGAKPDADVVKTSTRGDGDDGLKTQAGSILGTPKYMSPEQARGEVDNLDARTDIYSLGAILYEILALRAPISGDSLNKVLMNVISGRIDALPQESPILRHLPETRVPQSLASVALKALALKRSARYASVEHLQSEITAYQAGYATKAENAGAFRQISLLVLRHKAVAALLALMLVSSAGFMTKVILSERKATQSALDAKANEIAARAAEKEQARLRVEAETTLTQLRGTAPTFAAQARALVEDQKFGEALEKIGFAIGLDSANADFHLFRANTLQALSRLGDAGESYRRVLELRPGDLKSTTNLALCEKLMAENNGNPVLTAPLKTKLLKAILAQNRQADAVPLSRELNLDALTGETQIKNALKSIMAQPKWVPDKLKPLGDGTFLLDLRDQNVASLGILAGLPISRLDISGLDGVDYALLRQVPALRSLALREIKGGNLEALRGLKLQYLSIQKSDFSDLSPLAGMPLTELDLTVATRITDLSPLRGMPLKTLWLPQTKVRSLQPLRGMPLEMLNASETPIESLDGIQESPLQSLGMARTPVADLTVLRGLPLKTLNLFECSRLTDLTPLAECKALESLLVPAHLSDIAFLKSHPTLKRLSNRKYEEFNNWTRITPAADFWKKNGDRLARQVPMEKQLEKFRQSLIAQGNDPDKVPRFVFDAEGDLFINMPSLPKVSDISELRGVAVTKFLANCSSLRDLSPLAGAPLRELTLYPLCDVSDLSPLKDAPLERLYLDVVPVRDLSIVRKMPLKMVYLKNCPIPDISPLADVPTLEFVLLPSAAKNVELLRKHPKIAMISYEWDVNLKRPKQTAAEFWKDFDAKKSAAPK